MNGNLTAGIVLAVLIVVTLGYLLYCLPPKEEPTPEEREEIRRRESEERLAQYWHKPDKE